MLATFHGRVENGKIRIEELERSAKMLEQKRLAVISLEANEEEELESGQLKAGVYNNGCLEVVGGGDLKDFEGKQVFVVVRHEFFVRHQAFDQKFQLGAKIGDVDK
jgi:hypothetical protein